MTIPWSSHWRCQISSSCWGKEGETVGCLLHGCGAVRWGIDGCLHRGRAGHKEMRQLVKHAAGLVQWSQGLRATVARFLQAMGLCMGMGQCNLVFTWACRRRRWWFVHVVKGKSTGWRARLCRTCCCWAWERPCGAGLFCASGVREPCRLVVESPCGVMGQCLAKETAAGGAIVPFAGDVVCTRASYKSKGQWLGHACKRENGHAGWLAWGWAVVQHTAWLSLAQAYWQWAWSVVPILGLTWAKFELKRGMGLEPIKVIKRE